MNLTKEKIYLEPGQKAPEGVNVQQGPQGGKFYEAKPSQHPQQAKLQSFIHRPKPEPKQEYKEVKVVSPQKPLLGEGYFITNRGQLIDISGDFGDGTNDHVGFLSASDDPKLAAAIGLTEKERKKLSEFYMSGESDEEVGRITYKLLTHTTRIRLSPNYVAVNGPEINDRTKQIILKIIRDQNMNQPKILWEDAGDNYKEYSFGQFLRKEAGAVTSSTAGANNPRHAPLRSQLIRAYAITQLKNISKAKVNIGGEKDLEIKSFIEDFIYGHNFAWMDKKKSEKIKDYIVRSIMHKYRQDRVTDYIKRIAPGTSGFQANNIYRTEMNVLKNKAREWSYNQLDPEGELKYKWIGPNDHRTTAICKSIAEKTQKGVTIEKLKQILKEEVDIAKEEGTLPDTYQLREWTPHFSCRHTFIQAY